MTDKDPKYFWKGTPKNSSETFTGFDAATGKDYGCKVTGHMKQGKLFIDDIEYEKPDPLMEEHIQKLTEQAVQTREDLIRKILASGHCLDDVAGFKEEITTKENVTEYSCKLVLREDLYKEPTEPS